MIVIVPENEVQKSLNDNMSVALASLVMKNMCIIKEVIWVETLNSGSESP